MMARPKQRATIERDENKRISIIDVAREAGVSPATVSRVLHNKPIVDPKVRDMVRETVARMNYRPSFAARNLPMGRTGYLALATPRGSQNIFTNPYVFPSLEGIGKVVDESSFHLIIATTPKQISNLLETHAVDGMILIQFQMDDTEVEAIEKSGIPAVVVGAYKQDTRLSVLTPDYPTSVQIAVEHLAKLGHREIGFICGPPNTFKWRSNQIAFGESIQQLGLREVGSLVTPKYTEESGYTAFRSLIEKGTKPPTAFVSTSDNIAIGVINAAQDCHLKVPGDLSVIGYGNIPASRMAQPPLTTVASNLTLMASDAAQLLIEIIETKNYQPRRVKYPVSLITRESTGPPIPGAT
jgi:LacI family transcriptional regulator